VVLAVFPFCKRRLFTLQKTAFYVAKDYVSILQKTSNRNTKSRLLHGEDSRAAVINQNINILEVIFAFIHL